MSYRNPAATEPNRQTLQPGMYVLRYDSPGCAHDMLMVVEKKGTECVCMWAVPFWPDPNRNPAAKFLIPESDIYPAEQFGLVLYSEEYRRITAVEYGRMTEETTEETILQPEQEDSNGRARVGG